MVALPGNPTASLAMIDRRCDVALHAISIKCGLVSIAIIASITAILGSITADTVMTMAGVGGGVAAALIWLWRAPRDAQFRAEIRSHTEQIEGWERRLEVEERAHDKTRERLGICQSALVEAGVRIRELEAKAKENKHE